MKIRTNALRFHSSIRSVVTKISDSLERILSKDYIKTIIISLLIVFISYLFAKRIAVGHLRTVIIFSIFLLLAAASINLKSGILAIIIYLPIMAFIRRYIYVYGRYVAMDPILVISDVITIWMFVYLIIFRGKEIYRLFRTNRLVKFATILLFIFILQMFNPRQGSILVGIGGAKFYIIPFLWFYFGLFLDKKYFKKILIIIGFIGVITALYGLKQTFFGFTQFENYWIEYGGYSSLHLFRIIRSFSTFASAGEYAHYLTMAGIICFALLLKSRFKVISLVGLIIVSSALFISAVRSAIFTFVLSNIILVGFLVRDRRKGALLILILLLSVVLFISRTGIIPEVNEFDPISVTSHHALKGITNPIQESTFKTRLWVWTVNFPRLFIKSPFGYGLGTSTLAAWKFGSRFMATENILLDIVLSTGFIGAIGFLLVLISVISFSVKYIKREKENLLGIIALVIPLSYLLIGSSSEYTIFPIIWLLWGMIASQNVKRQEDSVLLE